MFPQRLALAILLAFIPALGPIHAAPDPTNATADGYRLVWADEFDKDGKLNEKDWTYEKGFVRNHELQWYQPDNAFCEKGMLILEGRREKKAQSRLPDRQQGLAKEPQGD